MGEEETLPAQDVHTLRILRGRQGDHFGVPEEAQRLVRDQLKEIRRRHHPHSDQEAQHLREDARIDRLWKVGGKLPSTLELRQRISFSDMI